MKEVIIIGAGIGGLSAACRLARAGFSVTILEKNKNVGGKVNFKEVKGYKFDTGASLLTLPHILEELFLFCGRRVEDYLKLVKLDPICRYFWADGSILDIFQDMSKTKFEIAKISPEDAKNFERYIADAKEKYEIAERTFLAASLNDLPRFLISPQRGFLKNLRDLLKLSSLSTLDEHNSKYFHSQKLCQLFNRFATYNGSSPYEAPATFALIPYVEFGFGAWYPIGGMYEIPKALAKLASELGVRIFTEVYVKKILVKNGSAVGVKTEDEILKADIIISNADGVETYRRLLSLKNKFVRREPSCSGFVVMLGVRRRFPQLAHHNIFFSDDYKAEFEAIFKEKIPARQPTIYVCVASRTDASQAPENCENLFILANAPYLTDKFDWETQTKSYRDLIIKRLEDAGLEFLNDSIEVEEIITPADFEKNTCSNRGSIYGISSNGILSSFLRIPNKCKEIANLYFVGGAAHPGGGIPLVLLSGKMTSEMIIKNHST